MDEAVLFGLLIAALLNHLQFVLDVLSHNRGTLNINKTIFIGPYQEFLGINVTYIGNYPIAYKQPSFEGLLASQTLSELIMIIIMFSFYSLWIPYYEIHPPPPRTSSSNC